MACVSGSVQNSEEVKQKILDGAYQLVLFTPEMLLQSKQWRGMLNNEVYTENLKALIVDEAHTVKKRYVTLLAYYRGREYIRSSIAEECTIKI